MEKNVYITVGISGCGKSTWCKKHREAHSDVESLYICPDEIRKELTGNVSDQSKNSEVFSLAEKRLLEGTSRGVNVYWDATNLNPQLLERLIGMIGHEYNIALIVFNRSKNWQACKAAVRRDIKNGTDRSETSEVVVKDDKGNDIPLIKAMSKNFAKMKKFIRSGYFYPRCHAYMVWGNEPEWFNGFRIK